PATSRFAVRAGLASLAAASYLTTGRSLPRLHPDERARNSGVFSVDVARAEWPLHAMAAAIFATYPFFIKLGRRLGRRI
ncbi:hypothetical protein KJD70_02590, partial [Mycobacterium tuberculosis]|nr:hypothetical protein [Mycobacterium tuberculosis]